MNTNNNNYIIKDLQRTVVRIAANERWYDQEWLGVPIWQLPDDLLRLQKMLFEIKPRWIIETGTKFGGSAVFFASILKCMGLQPEDAGIFTIDITLLPEATHTFATHPLGSYVHKSLEGDAASPTIVDQIRPLIQDQPGPVLVFLDDNHNADHVLREMNLYASLVTPSSYLIVADTVFEDLAGTPIGVPNDKYPDVARSNPRVAVTQFLENHPEFQRDQNVSLKGLSNFPDGFLKRV